MSATSNNQSSDFRAEFDALKNEVSQFMNTFKSREEERLKRVRSNVSDGVSQAGETAKETLRSARKVGEDTLEDVEGRIRDNPIKSLAIAFTVGYLASKLGRTEH